jgi:ABC-2 type transport system ATP-binding protein
MLVEVRNLTVRFGDFTAVQDVSFAVDAREIFGFLGANGAGKTTTIRVLCGILRPTSGSVRIGGVDLEADPMAVKEKVGYMSQRFTLYDDLTVEENLSFVAGLRHLSGAAYRRRRQELLEFIGFDRSLRLLVRDLPGGVKQQVSLAAAVLHDPPVIFLDEPTAGVTPAARARFWALIRRLAGAGKCVFVTTHYMDEAEQCGRIALMRAGEIIALDRPAALKERTFPQGVIELAPRTPQAGAGLAPLLEQPAAASVQPYGLRYHALIRDPARWLRLEPALAEHFTVTRIAPSLEDVFIELVEGRNR